MNPIMTADQQFAQMVAEGDIVLDKLDHWALHAADKVFIHYGETAVRLTFGEFKRITDRLAAGLATLGVKPGEPVCVLTRNSLVSALAMFAIWRAGGIFAPINFNFKGRLLAYQLNDTAPAALVTDASFADTIAEIIEGATLRQLIIHSASQEDYDHAAARLRAAASQCDIIDFGALCESTATAPAIARSPYDIANIVYTSGTTGPSKGVVQNFRWMNQYGFPGRLLSNSEDVIYCDLPLYHVGGAFYLVARAVWNGNTVGLWDRFSHSRFWQRIAECGATTCVLLDVMVPWLMSAEPRPEDRANTLNKVHMQPLPVNHHEVARRFSFDFVTAGFGQTESGAPFSGVIDQFGEEVGTPASLYRGLSKAEYRARCHTFGRLVVDGRKPLPKGFMGTPSPLFEAAILDEEDNVLPPGMVGQLALRPRFPGLLLQEYFRKPEATIKVLRNCWFHTGDACARLEGEGDVFVFIDRMGGFFRVRGENVSSYEVEALVNGHPKVRATAAIPIPALVGDEEDIAVFIELVDGETLSEDELRAYSAEVMPKYMTPKYVRFVDALPVTPTNKIEKYKLKQALISELGIAPRR
jgi:crotonobetaine/carnitine-CoA ligase